MAWTLCTSGSALTKAGLHVNSDISGSITVFDEISTNAEGTIEQETNTSWITNIGTLSLSIKKALADLCSSRIAKVLIAYDTTGYLRREADTLMNINDDIEIKALKFLKGKADSLKTP